MARGEIKYDDYDSFAREYARHNASNPSTPSMNDPRSWLSLVTSAGYACSTRDAERAYTLRNSSGEARR
jgi:hypothetical protein